MSYSYQTFSVGQVLTAAQVQSLMDSIRDHLHGSDSVAALTGAMGASVVHIQSQTASGSASLNFTTGLSGYGAYLVIFDHVVPATNAANLQLQVSEDAGANWKNTGYHYAFWSVDMASGSGTASNSSQTQANIAGGVSNSAAYGVNGFLLFPGMSTAARHEWFEGVTFLSGSNITSYFGGGAWDGSSVAINGIKFFESTGNISSGTIRIFGIRNA